MVFLLKKSQIEKHLLDRIEDLSLKMERMQLAEYMNMLNDPKRYLMVNFLGGVARGLGMAVGFTLLGALVIYFLQRVVLLNLPVIGDFIADIVRLVQNQTQGGS
ncbi:hypothetical protein HYG86_16910 [Alkalicella caledoniensis]|uniref:Uncharacterized protein n=1 Tax=Alkalicella caledoniensis TaxID=2731377 RepID=A0A7G9WCB7_ALKCA|nr:hypothetical protein HYG86_16910 [Alkalicella caledoniensis]